MKHALVLSHLNLSVTSFKCTTYVCYNRSGSRDPVTYTFRTTFGLAIIHCVRQVDSQASHSTPPSVDRSKRRPTARLLTSKLTSSSVGM